MQSKRLSQRSGVKSSDHSESVTKSANVAHQSSRGLAENTTAGSQSKELPRPPAIHSVVAAEYPRVMSTESEVARGSQGGRKVRTSIIIQPPRKQRFRMTAVIPFLLSAAAFAISIVLVLSGSTEGRFTDVNIVSFNTSNLGTGIIKIAASNASTAVTSAGSSTTSGGLGRRQTSSTTPITKSAASSTTAPLIQHRDAFNPLDPFGLLPSVTSFIASRASADASLLASGGSALASAFPLPTLSNLPLPTSLNPGTGSTTTTGFLDALGKLIEGGLTTFLSPVIQGLESSGVLQIVDEALNRAVQGLISDVIDSAGVQDYYSLYVMGTCKGNSSSSISDCSSFSSTTDSISNISSMIPSSFKVAGTNISSPALGQLTSAVSSLAPVVDGVEKLLIAFIVISLINSGLSIILSFLGIFFPSNRIILYANLSLASIGILIRSINATLSTTISVLLAYLTNEFGSAVGAYASVGGIFIALIWIGFLCQSVASLYWVYVWFVEFRQVSFRIRKRNENEVGNYRGILREVGKDIRLAEGREGGEKDSGGV